MSEGSNTPLVSVIIPHYGGEKIIRECLQSLQNISYNIYIIDLHMLNCNKLSLTVVKLVLISEI